MSWKALAADGIADHAYGLGGVLTFAADGTMSYVANEPYSNNSVMIGVKPSSLYGTLAADGSSGKLRVHTWEIDHNANPLTLVAKNYRYVFDSTHMQYDEVDSSDVSVTGTDKCYSRADGDKQALVHGYQLFTEAGAAVKFSGPFPFTYLDASLVSKQGYLGAEDSWFSGGENGTVDKGLRPATITRSSDQQSFSACFDYGYNDNGSERDDGTDDNVNGANCNPGAAQDGVYHSVVNSTTNVEHPFDAAIAFDAVTFLNQASATTPKTTVSNLAGAIYNRDGSNLQLPYECLVGASWILDNGSNCSSASDYRPAYTLPDSTQLTKTGTATTYRVKAKFSQINLKETAGSCSDIPLSGAPTVVAYVAADAIDTNLTLTWPTMPTVTAANTIKVIHGVEQ